MVRSLAFLSLLICVGAATVSMRAKAETNAASKPIPAFKKGMYTVVFEVGLTPTKVVTRCEVSKVQDPSKAPAVVVKFKVSQKYRQAACKQIAESLSDPRVGVSDPYYTYLMVDPAHPDVVIPR
jgi:hypothetical protein